MSLYGVFFVEKRRKQTHSDDVRAALRNRASSPRSLNRQGAAAKPVTSPLSSSSDLQKGTQGKLKGSFRPWSAVASGILFVSDSIVTIDSCQLSI